MKYGAINGYDELANLIMDTCNMIVDKNIVEIPTSIIACSISILYLMYFLKKIEKDVVFVYYYLIGWVRFAMEVLFPKI